MWEFFAAHIFGILASIVAAGGIGAVVLAVAFGVPAALILANVVQAVRAAINFFTTPLGQAVGVLILLVFVFFVADIRRTRLDAAEWNRRIEAAEVARKARDETIREEMKHDADGRISKIQSEKDGLAEKAEKYDAIFGKRPQCLVTDDDLKRMR